MVVQSLSFLWPMRRNRSWESLLTTVAQRLGERKTVLVGWSLGGNLCGCVLRTDIRNRVARIVVTLGSTPCFVATDGWSHGKTAEEFQAFTNAVVENMAVVLKGFIPTCASGGADQKGAIRLLRQTTAWTLEQGDIWPELLARLAEDARSVWQKRSGSGDPLSGSSDPLAKVAIADDLQRLQPEHNVRVVTGSHAIFFDHTMRLWRACWLWKEIHERSRYRHRVRHQSSA